MTRRERVLQALRHQKTDFVPYHLSFTQEAYAAIVAYTGDEDFYEHTGGHLAMSEYTDFKEVAPDMWQDHFGVVWNRTKDKDIGVLDNTVIPDELIHEDGSYDYTMPVFDEQRLRKGIEDIIRYGDDRFLGYGIGFSLFERAWTLRGMENLLCDMVVNPDFVHRLMGDICEYNLKILDIINEYDEIDCVYFGDDWGQQKGLIMGEPHWREYIKPYLGRMYAKAKEKGKYIFQHSCGDIESIYPDLIELGLDVHNTFQPEIFDAGKIKALYGDRLTIWGGISTQCVLAHGTPDEVREETIRMIRTMGYESGGYIVAPTHGIPRDVPCANILAMLDVFRNQDKYLG